MIKLQILDSPDLLSLGVQSLNFYNVTLGRSLKNSIIIDDPELNKEHLILKCGASGLTVWCNQFYLLNDKKIKGITYLKENDLIKVGKTTFKIIAFENNNEIGTDDYYNFLEMLDIQNTPLYELVSSLEDEFVNQTTKQLNVLDK